MFSRQITAVLIITADTVCGYILNPAVQKHERHTVVDHGFNLLFRLHMRKIQNPVNRKGNRCIDELLGEIFIQLHTEDQQTVPGALKLRVHFSKHLTEMLVMQVIDNYRDDMTFAGSQR